MSETQGWSIVDEILSALSDDYEIVAIDPDLDSEPKPVRAVTEEDDYCESDSDTYTDDEILDTFSNWPSVRRDINDDKLDLYDEGWKWESVIDERVYDKDIYPDDFAKLVGVDSVTSFLEPTRVYRKGDETRLYFDRIYIKIDFHNKMITYYTYAAADFFVMPERAFINFSDGYYPIEDDKLYRIDCSKLKVYYKIDNGSETTDKIELKDEIIYLLSVQSCGSNVFVRMDSQLAEYEGYCSDEFTLYVDDYYDNFNVVLFKENIITLKNAQRRS